VPAGPADKYILPSNEGYVSGLTKLKSQISLLAGSPTGASDPNLVNQTLSAVGDANAAVGQLAQKFRVDPEFHIETVSQNLLTQPLDHAAALIKIGSKEPLNGGGRTFCMQLSQIAGKFPLNPNSSEDIPLDQLNAILAPNTGALWTFYNTKLAQYITKQGSRYDANNAGSIKISPVFVGFFNRVAALSDALYSGGPTPHVTYSLKQGATTMEDLALKIGNDTLTGAGQQKTFSWTGASESVLVTTKGVPVESLGPGPWAPFRFFNDGHPAGKGMSTYDLEFVYKQSNGQDVIVNGKRQSYSYQLQFSGPNPLMYFPNLGCVSQVVR
jgi:type VI secretion system protein ImpL